MNFTLAAFNAYTISQDQPLQEVNLTTYYKSNGCCAACLQWNVHIAKALLLLAQSEQGQFRD